MKYLCNPININYRYQFNRAPRQGGRLQICREAAGPSMSCFRGRYYIFASMTLGVWVSDDLAHWENHRLPKELPLYDYALDVRVIGSSSDPEKYAASAKEREEVMALPGMNDSGLNTASAHYVWLPARFENGKPVIEWLDAWKPVTE